MRRRPLTLSEVGKGDPVLPSHRYQGDCSRWLGRWEGRGECQEFGGAGSARALGGTP